MVNSVAGGGTFLTFPTLTGVAKLSEKVANMTNTIGLWPGQAASVAAARSELRRLPRDMVVTFSIISLFGGILGAFLLLKTSVRTFGLLIPWLLAFATTIFAFSRPIARWAGRQHGKRSLKWTAFVAAVQAVVAVYGGYFGAGMGVLMLAGLAFAGLDDIHQMNAMKVLLTTIINGVAAFIFLFNPSPTDRVDWRMVCVMAIAAIIGGVLGMSVARKIKPERLRGIILAIGVTLTAVYFYKNYAGLLR